MTDRFPDLFKDVEFDASYYLEYLKEREASRVHLSGYSERGPVNKKIDISSRDEFEHIFGNIYYQKSAAVALANGALVSFTRTVSPSATKACSPPNEIGGAMYVFEAIDEGEWGNDLEINIFLNSTLYNFELTVKYLPQWRLSEKFIDMTVKSDDPRSFPEYVNDRSRLIQIKEVTNVDRKYGPFTFKLTGGKD